MKTLNNWRVAPDYPRIPHLSKDISNMSNDDIVLDTATFPFTADYQEKVDGANLGISWNNDGPVVRNRNFVLNKGYTKTKTPSKRQFVNTWQWIHKHEDDIKEVIDRWMAPLTIYGEWMWAKHSIEYNKLPDLFLAYDIWSPLDNKFVSVSKMEELLDGTNIRYIPSIRKEFKTISDVKQTSELKSKYTDDYAEGIVIKICSERWVEKTYKVVNQFYNRRDDFNDVDIIRNKVLDI
jgi:atypical dual specificity phosphatase